MTSGNNSKRNFEVPLPIRCELGEGPLWDVRKRCILWVDILSGRIHEYDPVAGTHRTLETDALIGAIALNKDGDLLAALDTRIAWINRASGAQRTVCRLAESEIPLRFNDGKCGPGGRFWAGTMPLSEDKPAGSLYRLGEDGRCRSQLEGVTISNGLAWDQAGTTLYYIDTPTRAVQAFDFEPGSGRLENRRIAFRIPESEGFPDGMTIDTEDKLWIAHWGGWQVARWDPQTGQKLLGLRLPAANITSCTFGGAGLTDLYVTSARKGLGPAALGEQPLAGALFVFPDTGYRGWETNRFTYEPKFDET